jgi:hypothetical protein
VISGQSVGCRFLDRFGFKATVAEAIITTTMEISYPNLGKLLLDGVNAAIEQRSKTLHNS